MTSKMQIPSGWRLVRLEDVAEINPRRPKLDVNENTPVTFIPMAAVGTNCAGIMSREQREYHEVASGYTYFEEDDVLFAKITPCLQNGKHTLASGLTSGFGFGTTEFHVVRASSSINPSHLFRVLTQPHNIGKCEKSFSGTAGQQRVQPEILKSIPILLPPLSEQRAIAAVLDSIDEAIERTETVITATERLRESLLHELLTHGVPGWHTEWKEVRGIGTIPADWKVARLGDMATYVGSGVTPRGGRSAYQDSGVKFIRSQNVHFDGLKLDDVAYISTDTDEAMRRSRVLSGDVLLNITGASIGRCTVAPSELGRANVNQHVCIIRPHECANPNFISEWLGTPQSQREIDEVQIGQSRQGLNYQQVRALTIARPSRHEQDEIAKLTSSIRKSTQSYTEQSAKLEVLRTSVADALLTGRLRVAV